MYIAEDNKEGLFFIWRNLVLLQVEDWFYRMETNMFPFVVTFQPGRAWQNEDENSSEDPGN